MFTGGDRQLNRWLTRKLQDLDFFLMEMTVLLVDPWPIPSGGMAMAWFKTLRHRIRS